MINENLPKFIHRYMDLPELIYCLQNNVVILGNPLNWDDKNDYFLIGQYVEHHSLNNLFVSCFTTFCDAYHFWKIYASSATGICVTYDTTKIIDAINNDSQSKEFRFDKVKYESMSDLSKREVPIEDYPFIKRVAYKSEEEYRLIFSSKNAIPYRTIKVNDAISKIVLSPKIRDIYSNEYIKLICSNKNIQESQIHKSTILESDRWKQIMRY